jgi:endonuclease/exonuclease/phosphatase family metal-dependent hydrolase
MSTTKPFVFLSRPRVVTPHPSGRAPILVHLGGAILVASVFAGSAPAEATDAVVRVMMQNVYQGTNFDEVVAATTPAQFLAAVTATYNNIMATQPVERAQAVANEIAREAPDIVSLQEVATLTTSPEKPGFDYLALLQADLVKLGHSYSVVATLPEFSATAPSDAGFAVSIARGDAVLVRDSANATLANIQTQTYLTNPSIPTAIGPINDNRGFISVDVSVGGAEFRFVTTHLITFQPAQLGQMNELISSQSGATLPLVMIGDFNANADDPGDPTFATYQAALDAGFLDAWSVVHGGDPGFTCCQAQDLMNVTSSLDQRIDLTLLRGGVGVDDFHLIGDEGGDRTLSGLWPSDHAGVVSTLKIPVVPEESTWILMLIGFGGLALFASRGSARLHRSLTTAISGA